MVGDNSLLPVRDSNDSALLNLLDVLKEYFSALVFIVFCFLIPEGQKQAKGGETDGRG